MGLSALEPHCLLTLTALANNICFQPCIAESRAVHKY